MSKVFVDVGVSLDGFIAGPNGGPSTPLGEGGLRIHSWVFGTRSFRERLNLGEGGGTGTDDDIVRDTFDRIGANVMGKRMFEEGEVSWPEEAPFHTPVFVLTHEVRQPWERPGGTTFHFVNDGMESALRQATAAAGEKDVRVSGGAETIRQYLNAGAVEELVLHIAPVLMGAGVRLFDGVDTKQVSFRIVETVASPAVTHVRYEVGK